LDHVVGDDLGDPRDLVQEAEAARLDRRVETHVGGEMEQRRDFPEVEQRLGVEVGELEHHVDETPVRSADEVIRGDEAAGVVGAARSARPSTRGIGSRVRLRPRRWTATTDMSSETVMTGTSIWRPTRSAVRWRVPVSEVGMLGSGTRCTLARATRDVSEARMVAPSIFANSDSR